VAAASPRRLRGVFGGGRERVRRPRGSLCWPRPPARARLPLHRDPLPGRESGGAWPSLRPRLPSLPAFPVRDTCRGPRRVPLRPSESRGPEETDMFLFGGKTILSVGYEKGPAPPTHAVLEEPVSSLKEMGTPVFIPLLPSGAACAPLLVLLSDLLV
jgi:hypothetical protein